MHLERQGQGIVIPYSRQTPRTSNATGRRQSRIVELHFFGGLNFEEIAVVLNVSARTVKRDWSMARAWLKREISKEP